MTKDRIDGKITIGEIEEVIFKFRSGKITKACSSYESWEQYSETNTLIDPDVLDATFDALRRCGYLEDE